MNGEPNTCWHLRDLAETGWHRPSRVIFRLHDGCHKVCALVGLARSANPHSRIVLCLAVVLSLALCPLPGYCVMQSEPTLVSLHVIAVDSHGNPVRDLTRDDFRVFDSGKEQKIAFFHDPDPARWHSRPLLPNEFSNRGGVEIPYATVILFDLMNESFATRGYAVDQIVHSLENLETADYLFLYMLSVNGRLFVIHGLPDSGKIASSANAAPWTRQIKSLLDGALRKVQEQRSPDIDVAARVYLTFQALGTLAARLTRIPGRKNILWISDGVPIALGPARSDTGEIVDFTPQIRKLGEELDQAGVAIYPVREILSGQADGIGSTSDGEGATGGADTGIESLDTLNQFAGMTGGRPDLGKDFGAALKQADSDLVTSYQLGYYPPENNWNNKFHKLRVLCDRKGVRIQTKTGYYAWVVPAGTRAERAVRTAASNSFDAAEIGLRATVATDPKDGRVSHFDLHVDARDIALAQQGNDYLGQLRVTVVHYLEDGKAEGEPLIPFDLHFSPQQHEEALKDGIDFAQNVPVVRNGYQFRIIVFDRGSNAIGSLTIPDYENSRLVLPQLKGQ